MLHLNDLDIVGDLRESHFMMGVEFVINKDAKEPFSPDDNIGLRFAKASQKRGLIARPLGNILILSPTLIMDEPLIAKIGAILRDSIIEVTKGLSS